MISDEARQRGRRSSGRATERERRASVRARLPSLTPLVLCVKAEVRYVTGECFATLLRDEAEARLEAAAADAGRDCAALQAELAAAEREMEALKKLLYAKFGNAINLETD